MQNPIQHSRSITPVADSSADRVPRHRGFPEIVLALGLLSLVFSETTRALDPPPDGGYPNNITAEGTNALFSDTAGFNNTATGFQGLLSNTIGSFNTAIGYESLLSSSTASDNTAIGADALNSNTTGSGNTALGSNAGVNLTTGS